MTYPSSLYMKMVGQEGDVGHEGDVEQEGEVGHEGEVGQEVEYLSPVAL